MNNDLRPRARKEKLIVQELAEETLVYDKKNDKAHCLNAITTTVWRNCNGEKTVKELTGILYREFKITPDENVVILAIDQLKRVGLLEKESIGDFKFKQDTRRELIKRIGLVGAAAMIPLITSIVIPTAANAGSCVASGETCSISADCCSGLCSSSVCV